jgi:hypothetical protein
MGNGGDSTLSLCLSAKILAVIKKRDTDMDAQSATVETLDSGLTSGTIPKGCDDAQNGVSVRNVPVENGSHIPPKREGYDWYVFRASYGREDRASRLLHDGLGVFTYVPRRTIYTRTATGVKPKIENLLPNIVFAFLPKHEAHLYVKGPSREDASFRSASQETKKTIFELNALLSFYYDHFQKGDGGMNMPLLIPHNKMELFVNATWPEKNVIALGQAQQLEYAIGEEVEVVEGVFKGLIGRVIRKIDKKQRLGVQFVNAGMQQPISHKSRERRRLLFQLPCLGSFGSAYIPVAYFRKID